MVEPRRPLEGIRVLELGALVAAPYCGMLLADLGADVIKIEPPEGDMARRFAPFVAGESAFFMAVNRGKRSVVLDLNDPDGQAAARELAASCDVLVHNYRTGVAERLGMGYEDLASTNRGLVYCAVSGYGPSGPMAKRPGIDLLFQAESGMMAITGGPDGEPVKVGSNAADVYAATMASTCILGALVERGRSGEGTRIDISLRDAFLALQACWVSSYLATGEQPTRLGTESPFTAPTGVYRTGDGSIVLAVVNEKHWRIFHELLALPSAVDDGRFNDNEKRVAHADVLREMVEAVLAGGTTAEWLAKFERSGIPAGRVMGYAEVVDDPQIQFNDMILKLQHPVAGEIHMQGVPFWLDGQKPERPTPPPVLGASTDDVLGMLSPASSGDGPWRPR